MKSSAAHHATIIGGGLAGCEAAWQLATRGVSVTLHEMRPFNSSEAHTTSNLCELVCSNSLGSLRENRAPAILKDELTALNSLVLKTAFECRVKAGSSLTVERKSFSASIENRIYSQPNITVIRGEVTELPDKRPLIIATGPLTSSRFHHSIEKLLGEPSIYFFDAIAPIITCDSIDYNIAFFQNRGEAGDGDYLNCPFHDRQDYFDFIDRLTKAPTIPLRDFDNPKYFSGCMPIEILAGKGVHTPRYGPMKPVGIENREENSQWYRPYAVVQLRQEKVVNDSFNLVGFQTNLKYGAQKEVFRTIPGLQNAEFIRYGQMHRNTFINSPRLINRDLSLKSHPDILFAGQIVGVEGYVESIAMGLVAGVNLERKLKGDEPINFPETTAIGSLQNYLINQDSKIFQPMNFNLGLMKNNYTGRDKQEKRRLLGCGSREDLSRIIQEHQL